MKSKGLGCRFSLDCAGLPWPNGPDEALLLLGLNPAKRLDRFAAESSPALAILTWRRSTGVSCFASNDVVCDFAGRTFGGYYLKSALVIT